LVVDDRKRRCSAPASLRLPERTSPDVGAIVRRTIQDPRNARGAKIPERVAGVL
jgi:hypothetical protein